MVAALLVLPPGSVTAGFTAAHLWRLEGLPADAPLEFLVPGRAGSVRLAGALLRFEAFTGVDLPDGIPATSLPRTVIDLVARSSFADGVVLAEAALRTDPTLPAELVREWSRRTPRRGAATVRQVLAVADVLSESVLESRARVLWLTAGLPRPTQQAVLGYTVLRFTWADIVGRPEQVVSQVWAMIKKEKLPRKPG